MKYVKWLGIVILIALAGMQFVRPDRTNPPVDHGKTLQANTQVPPEVQAIFQRSCYDCHSNQTVWPWYSNVAPVSWFLADHVEHGREELSFSEWGNYDAKKADHKLEEICEMIEKGEMPLQSYLILHWGAKLSETDRQTLCNWANQERARIKTVVSEHKNKEEDK
ncbi:MAG: heme-binding domain-containing protein [Acidobacteriota bacterium]|nr:MAG: heme-binding domain-containing protein [Acidobacteriota bacterium]